MVEPINYAAYATGLDLTPLAQALAMRREQHLAQQQRDFERQQQQAKVDRRDGFVRAFQNVLQSGGQPAGFQFLRANYPDFLEPIDSAWKAYTDTFKKTQKGDAVSIVAALSNNQPQLALDAIDRRIRGLKNGGYPTAESEAVRAMIASGDPKQMQYARGIANFMLSQENDDFEQTYAELNRVKREDELQPERVRKARADADAAESRAHYAPIRAEAEIEGRRARTENTLSLRDRREAGRASRTKPDGRGNGAVRDVGPARPPKGAVTATGPGGVKLVLRNGRWERFK